MSLGRVSMTIGCTLAPRYSGVEPILRPARTLNAIAYSASNDRMRIRTCVIAFISLAQRRSWAVLQRHLENLLYDHNRVRVFANTSRCNAEIPCGLSDPWKRQHAPRRRRCLKQFNHVPRELRWPVERQFATELAVERTADRIGEIALCG